MTAIQLSDCELFVEDRGSGSVVLLVHGFPLDHSMWSEQIDRLAESHRVIAPDLRGFGRSSGALETISMAQFADDLADLLDALGVDEPVTLCGLSMGGYIAWQFWDRHRARLARLILCDTRAAPDTEEAAANRRATAQRVESEGSEFLADGMIEKLFSPQTRAANGVVVAATSQVIRDAPPSAVAGALRGMASRPDMTPVLAEIQIPVLAICGSEDAITPASEMREFAAQIPNCRYVEISEAGHMAPLERPVEVNQVLSEFLQ